MRVWRLEVYRCAFSLEFWYLGMCGCHFYQFLGVGVTWLNDECYGIILEKRGKALKRLANIRRIRDDKKA